MRSRLGAVDGLDSSAESHFFDKPRAREVREFAESKAITNDAAIATNAWHSDAMGGSFRQLQKELAITPPTVTEVLRQPGSETFGTLNRYVVQTEADKSKGLPTGHEDVRKHPKI